jgi:hypothetical protein
MCRLLAVKLATMLPKISSFSDVGIWIYFGTCLILGAGFAIIYGHKTRKRGLELIKAWARSNHFTIMSISQPTIVPLWKMRQGSHFFRVVLSDKTGVTRKCWVQCLDFVYLTKAKPLEIIWDQKP